ncbi:cupin domain-containing protein [Parasphingopyxis sp.]|uniref:cupin domain-containing protein n=1 Tax=Parasphingopyxis sp. TaxID=1920299 RepID=UPI00261DD65F|nr:cupin domain-containing protein [Parasphingopyxis sp.]
MHKYDPTPGLSEISRDALSRVLDPVDPGAFFTDIFEESVHLIARDEPDRYVDLVSVDVLDAFIANNQLFEGQIDATRAEPQITRDAFTLANDQIDRSALLRLYQDKATIIAPHLHSYHKPLGDFVRALEPVFSASVQTNIYLTPPGAKGFRTHYDNHDVFVLQVSGAKSWRIYDEPVGKPFRGEGFEPGVHEVGDPTDEFVLRAGDAVYIPRGMMHDADAHDEEASLHITLGLVTKTWADLVLESISKAALETDGLRRALPAGYANRDFDRGPARELFRAFIAELAEKAELDEPLDIIAEDYLKSRTPDMAGIVRHASNPIADDQRYRADPNALYRIVEDEESGEFAVVARGGSSEFVGAKRAAFDRAMSGDPFARSDLEGIAEADAADLIRRLMSRGLIQPV